MAISNNFPSIYVSSKIKSTNLYFSPLFPGLTGVKMERLLMVEISFWAVFVFFDPSTSCDLRFLAIVGLSYSSPSLHLWASSYWVTVFHMLALCCNTVSYDCDILQIRVSDQTQHIEENTALRKRSYRVLFQFWLVLGLSSNITLSKPSPTEYF